MSSAASSSSRRLGYGWVFLTTYSVLVAMVGLFAWSLYPCDYGASWVNHQITPLIIFLLAGGSMIFYCWLMLVRVAFRSLPSLPGRGWVGLMPAIVLALLVSVSPLERMQPSEVFEAAFQMSLPAEARKIRMWHAWNNPDRVELGFECTPENVAMIIATAGFERLPDEQATPSLHLSREVFANAVESKDLLSYRRDLEDGSSGYLLADPGRQNVVVTHTRGQ